MIPEAFTDPAFVQRRRQNWIVLGLLYAVFYMTRYNFAAVMANLSDAFGCNNTQLGVFESTMPLVYGLSVVLNGPVADRIGGKRAFLFGAAGVVVMNTLFGACIFFHASFPANTLLPVMVTIWGINGFFQSFGALSIVKVNAHWFHIRERGTFAGIFGVLIRFGLILAFSVVPLIITVLPLAFAFWVPATAVAVLFVLNYLLMENSPTDAGFPEQDTGDGDGDSKPAPLSFVLAKVFASKATWAIALTSMMIGMVRRSTIDSWYPKYFKELYLPAGTKSVAGFLPYQSTVWGIALCGIAGGFAFGIASDRVYGGRRAPVITFAFIGMIAMLSTFALLDHWQLGPWSGAVCLSLLSFFVNGAHGMVGGAASMDFGGKKAAATAAGLFDGMQYLASSFVGIGMGYMLDHWGWRYWQLAPIPFAIIGALVISRLWSVLPKARSAH